MLNNLFKTNLIHGGTYTVHLSKNYTQIVDKNITTHIYLSTLSLLLT